MPAEFDEQLVFGKKKMSDILKEIYERSSSKEKLIEKLILDLKGLINNNGDAVVMVPLIAQYLDMSIKNDDHLIKMAAIVQKAMERSKSSGGETMLTEEEKQQLLLNAEEMQTQHILKNALEYK